MKPKLKDRLKGIGLRETIKDAESINQRLIKRFSARASGATVASFTPYEVSEAHKAHMLELERKRSRISAEAHHQNPR